jgi:hypothetical protein
MIFPARYPRATWRPVSYTHEADDDADFHGWILHVVCGYGSPWSTFEHARRPNRRFSHLWFGKRGQVEQYAPLNRQSWAQAAGNPLYISCETEGQPDEQLTGPQINALALWHAWSQTDDVVATRPGQRGIGTHEMGGAAYGGHACPGPIRAGQRAEIIRRAQLYVARRPGALS